MPILFSERKNRSRKIFVPTETFTLALFGRASFLAVGWFPRYYLVPASDSRRNLDGSDDAMTIRTGMTLRLVGPLIEFVCLMIWLQVRDQERTFAGIPVEYPLYAGMAVGFALVVMGLFASRPRSRPPRDSA